MTSGGRDSSSMTVCGKATISTSHGRLAEHEVDGRREEAGLAPPARRRPEHDQVGVELVRALDDRGADRPRPNGRSVDGHRVLRAEELRLRERRLGPLVLVERAVRRAAARAARGSRAAPAPARPCSLASLTAVASISSPMIPSFIGTRIRLNWSDVSARPLVRRDHLLHQALAVRDDAPRRRRRGRSRARPARRSGRRDGSRARSRRS